MQDSDSARLRGINSELMTLYRRLQDEALDPAKEQLIRSQIVDLESEREALPTRILQDSKIQQYATILKSAASSLQLHRQSLQSFDGIPKSQQSPDEIRQKNILLNKLKTVEKKIDTYRQKLLEVGLLPYEIDDVILEGYREQHQRGLQKILRSLEVTLLEYLLDYYDQHTRLPDDLKEMIATWQQPDTRSRLNSTELQVLQVYENCLQHGIPLADIENVIRSVISWSDTQKQDNLNLLRSKLRAELPAAMPVEDIKTQVSNWIQRYVTQESLSPRQVEIVILIQKLRMYGISHKQLDSIYKSLGGQTDSIIHRLLNFFRLM